MKKLKYLAAIDEDGNYVAAENLTKENKGKGITLQIEICRLAI